MENYEIRNVIDGWLRDGWGVIDNDCALEVINIQDRTHIIFNKNEKNLSINNCATLSDVTSELMYDTGVALGWYR